MPRVITSKAESAGVGVRPLRTVSGVRPKPPAPSGAALLAALLILIASVFNLDIPYVAITPGPAIDVVELIDIKGAEPKKVTGRLLLTTVSLHEIEVAEAIRAWFDSSYEVLSRSRLIPSGETKEQVDKRSSDQMLESHENAAAAALSFLGYDVKVTPVGARVRELDPSAPAYEVLRRGDVIVGADAATVLREEDLLAVIKRHKVGDDIVLKVVRGDETLTVSTRTIGRAEAPSEPIIGVYPETLRRTQLPFAVAIDSLDIGGPSAGLMYALGIVDLLDDSDLARGRTIAGTGEITVDGVVGDVGGITQKVRGAKNTGAELFLVPKNELADACAQAAEMKVYGVERLTDAVRVLRDPAFAEKRSCR